MFTAATANSNKLEDFFPEMLQIQVDSSQLNIFVVLPSNSTIPIHIAEGKYSLKNDYKSPPTDHL